MKQFYHHKCNVQYKAGNIIIVMLSVSMVLIYVLCKSIQPSNGTEILTQNVACLMPYLSVGEGFWLGLGNCTF